MRSALIAILFLITNIAYGQITYQDSMQQFQSAYVSNHEVVKADDKHKMQFFRIAAMVGRLHYRQKNE